MSKNISVFVVFIFGLLVTSSYGQMIPDKSNYERLLQTPRTTVNTFLHWQMEGHRHPDIAAVTMMANPNLSEDERINLARQLLAILDAKGLIVVVDRVPNNPAHVDSLTGLPQYIMFDSLPQIYLEKQGDLWLFSTYSIEQIPIIYRQTYSVFVDVVVDKLPSSLKERYLGIALWQLIAIFVWILIGLIIRAIIEFLIENYAEKFASKTRTIWDERVLKEAKKPFSFLIMIIFFRLTYTNLMLSVTANNFLINTFEVAFAVFFIWLLYRMVNVLSEFLRGVTSKTESKLDDQLVPLLRKTLKIFIVVVGFLIILQNKGINVASLLAGLGIGGLAVALAARDTLANFFGSITIFADKPFQVGHWIKTGDVEGIVEEVGFRTTRIRTFYNSLVSVPNSRVADSAIDNLGMRQFRRILTTLNLTYSTSPEQMEAFVEGIKAMVKGNPKFRQDFYEVHFNDFGTHSLNVMVYVFLSVSTWSEELQEKHNFFLEILKLAKSVGVEFAFPTQTLHVDSFHKDKPRVAGQQRTDEELAAAVTSFAPNNRLEGANHTRVTYNGKELDFSSGKGWGGNEDG